MWVNAILLTLSVASATEAQTPNCVPPSDQQLIIYRAGSLTRAFQELEKVFTCQTGIQVKDFPMGSVDAGRQITAGGHACDLYAPADYLDIDLFMKPAGYSDFNIVFAQGRMVLAYSARGLSGKKMPPITDAGGTPFHPPASIPKAVPIGMTFSPRRVSPSGAATGFWIPGLPGADDVPTCSGVLQSTELV